MEFIILGAGGLLGSNLADKANERGHDVTATFHSVSPAFDAQLVKLDITNVDRFSKLLDEVDPDVVVNCAAMTDVDLCENEPDRAHEVNGNAPGRLAMEANRRNIAFAQVSTDYVFNGMRDGFYSEHDECNPVQVYGQSKLKGERRVNDSHDSPLIVRLSFLYGQRGDTGTISGFPAWLRSKLKSEGGADLFSDQYITPSRAGQVAETILDLVSLGEYGYYHVASRSCVTPYEFGQLLVGSLGKEKIVLKPASLNDVNRPAKRPSRTCLDVQNVEMTLGRPQPTLRKDLDSLLGDIRGEF